MSAVEFVHNIGMETIIIGMAATVRGVRENAGLNIETLEGTTKALFGEYIYHVVERDSWTSQSDNRPFKIKQRPIRGLGAVLKKRLKVCIP